MNNSDFIILTGPHIDASDKNIEKIIIDANTTKET